MGLKMVIICILYILCRASAKSFDYLRDPIVKRLLRSINYQPQAKFSLHPADFVKHQSYISAVDEAYR